MSTGGDRVRESVAALPEYIATDAIIQTKPAVWYAVGRYVSVKGHGVVLHADDPNVDEHVALLASPHAATALADLLDALTRLGVEINAGKMDHGRVPILAIANVMTAHDALEAALSRQPEPGETP